MRDDTWMRLEFYSLLKSCRTKYTNSYSQPDLMIHIKTQLTHQNNIPKHSYIPNCCSQGPWTLIEVSFHFHSGRKYQIRMLSFSFKEKKYWEIIFVVQNYLAPNNSSLTTHFTIFYIPISEQITLIIYTWVHHLYLIKK